METKLIWKFWVNTNKHYYRDFSGTVYQQLPLTCDMTDKAREEMFDQLAMTPGQYVKPPPYTKEAAGSAAFYRCTSDCQKAGSAASALPTSCRFSLTLQSSSVKQQPGQMEAERQGRGVSCASCP